MFGKVARANKLLSQTQSIKNEDMEDDFPPVTEGKVVEHTATTYGPTLNMTSKPVFGYTNDSTSTQAGDEEQEVVCGESLFISICEAAVQKFLEEHGEVIIERLLNNYHLQPKKKQKKQ